MMPLVPMMPLITAAIDDWKNEVVTTGGRERRRYNVPYGGDGDDDAAGADGAAGDGNDRRLEK